MKKIISLSVLVSAFPFGALALGTDATALAIAISRILGFVIPILITLAIVYFRSIWGIIQYMIGTDEEAKKGARMKIINSLIGLFIIVSFWGIVAFIQNSTGITTLQLKPSDIPCVPSALNNYTC